MAQLDDHFELTLNSPITDEQFDQITDIDFDHTDKIFFHTKNGREVVFIKLDLVKRMRDAQKQYFKTRDAAALRDSKQLEKQVDELIANNVKLF